MADGTLDVLLVNLSGAIILVLLHVFCWKVLNENQIQTHAQRVAHFEYLLLKLDNISVLKLQTFTITLKIDDSTVNCKAHETEISQRVSQVT